MLLSLTGPAVQEHPRRRRTRRVKDRALHLCMAASSSVPLWSAQQDGSGVDAGAEEGVGLDPFILPLPVVGLAVELVRGDVEVAVGRDRA